MTAPTNAMIKAELITQEQSDAALGRRIRELARELGQPVYIPPTADENGPIQVIALGEPLALQEIIEFFAGEFPLVVN